MPELARSREFRAVLLRAVWIPGILLAGVAAWFAWEMHRTGRMARELDRAARVVETARDAERSLVAEGESVNRYLELGDPAFRAAFEAAHAWTQPALARLAELVEQNREHETRLRAIRAERHRWNEFADARIRSPAPATEAAALVASARELESGLLAKLDELAGAAGAERIRLESELRTRATVPFAVVGVFALAGAWVLWALSRRASKLHAAALEELECRAREVERGRRRFEVAADTLGAVVYESDVETGRVLIVGAQQAIFGFEPGEFVASRTWWMEQIHPEDAPAVVPAYLASIAESRTFSASYRFRHKDGGYVHVWHRSATIVGADGGKCVIASIVDVSERRRLEDLMLQTDKFESIARLAGGIAHDFNNVTTAVLGYTEIAASHPGLPEPVLECLRNVHRAGERSASLTAQLVSFARRQVVEPRLLDLDELIRGIQDLLRGTVGAHVELAILPETRAPGDRLAPVRVDRGQFENVLLQLAAHGRDAMPQGGVLTIETASAKLEATRERPEVTPGEYVRLSVSDTGDGLREHERAHVFEPFFATHPHRNGSGLELASVHGAVKQAGGYIFVDSEIGRGTTFHIYLRAQPAAASEPESPLAPLPRGRGTILIAEDEPQVRAVAARVLRANGYTVIEAENGQAALASAEEHVAARGGGIDLLLTDVVMPGMSGSALAQAMSQRWPELKVLFASGYPESVIAEHGAPRSGVAFLSKPFTPSSLARGVQEALSRSKPYAELQAEVPPNSP